MLRTPPNTFALKWNVNCGSIIHFGRDETHLGRLQRDHFSSSEREILALVYSCLAMHFFSSWRLRLKLQHFMQLVAGLVRRRRAATIALAGTALVLWASSAWEGPDCTWPREGRPLRALPVDEASTYQGPFVEGWPPGADRDPRRYISCNPRRTLVARSAGCQRPKEVSLLVVVRSSLTNYAKRAANRASWMRLAKVLDDVAVFHVVGLPSAEPRAPAARHRKRLRSEMKAECDMLQVDVEDHYNNITLKTVR